MLIIISRRSTVDIDQLRYHLSSSITISGGKKDGRHFERVDADKQLVYYEKENDRTAISTSIDSHSSRAASGVTRTLQDIARRTPLLRKVTTQPERTDHLSFALDG